MNWYAYKVLADTYDAERRQQAAQHRRARQAARSARVRREIESVESAARVVTGGRLRSIAARLRSPASTTATAKRRPVARPECTELRPSLPQ
jgi:ferritin-like metal-binding protein YciE